MNLRILKKLSKRAAPLVATLCADHRLTHFVVEGRDGDTNVIGHDRKHWNRHRAANNEPRGRGEVFVLARTAGAHPFICLYQPSTPWDGTPGVGWTSGYYEREWEERTAWEYLLEQVENHTVDWVQDGEEDEWGPTMRPVATLRLRNPSVILRKAGELRETHAKASKVPT